MLMEEEGREYCNMSPVMEEPLYTIVGELHSLSML